MANLRQTPFPFSDTEGLPQAVHLSVEQFLAGIQLVQQRELIAFVRSFVQEKVPFAFLSRPLLWESVRNWIAGRHQCHPRQVGLSGSAQFGYSLRKQRPFDPKSSDLDLFIVNEALFVEVSREATKFSAANAESPRYNEQAATISRMMTYCRVDAKHIPADHDRYPRVARLLDDASIVIERLKQHGYSLKPSSFRVYADWNALGVWVRQTYRDLP